MSNEKTRNHNPTRYDTVISNFLVSDGYQDPVRLVTRLIATELLRNLLCESQAFRSQIGAGSGPMTQQSLKAISRQADSMLRVSRKLINTLLLAEGDSADDTNS